MPIDDDTFLALADALFSPVESDDRVMRVRDAAVASGRYAACPRCRGEGWGGCPLCHGKGIAAVDRIDAHHEARRVEAAAE